MIDPFTKPQSDWFERWKNERSAEQKRKNRMENILLTLCSSTFLILTLIIYILV